MPPAPSPFPACLEHLFYISSPLTLPLTAAALLSGIYPLRYRPCPRNSRISIRLFLLFSFFLLFFQLSPSLPPLPSLSPPFFLSLFFIRSPSPQRGSKVRSLTVRRRSRSYVSTFQTFQFRELPRSVVAAIRSSRAFFLFTTLPSSTLASATPDYASHFFLSLSRCLASASGGPLSSCGENFLAQHE